MWIIRNTIRNKDPDYYPDRSAEVFPKIYNIFCSIYYIYIINNIYLTGYNSWNLVKEV